MGTITREATISAHPSSYDSDHAYASVSTNHPLTNGETDSNSTTYAQVNWTTGSGAVTYVYYRFDFSAIPVGATIKSVSAKAKGYVNTTSSQRVTTRQMQLCAGTTLKGAALTLSTSTSEQTFTSVGTWTRAELLNAGIRYYIVRGTSNTTSNYTLRMYGATMTVTYEYQETTYTITVQNSTAATVTASDSEPVAGDDVEIIADTIAGLTIKDNGTDVTSQFVSGLSGSVSAVPGSYNTGGSINGTNYQSTIGKGSDTANRSGNDYFSTTQGGSGSTWIDYFFDFSEIPAGASIQSVSVTVKGHCESTTESREISRVQCYSGSTAKGSATDMTESTSDRVYTLSPGTWTRSELQSAKLRHTIGVYGGLVSGATWTVAYEIEGYVYTITSVSTNHTIVVTSGGGGNPPVITVGTPSRTRISAIASYDQCVCTFTSDLALSQWEARATKAGVTPARGVGLLVESGGSLAANTPATVYVENEELTQGDGEYTITVYGLSTGGIWSA